MNRGGRGACRDRGGGELRSGQVRRHADGGGLGVNRGGRGACRDRGGGGLRSGQVRQHADGGGLGVNRGGRGACRDRGGGAEVRSGQVRLHADGGRLGVKRGGPGGAEVRSARTTLGDTWLTGGGGRKLWTGQSVVRQGTVQDGERQNTLTGGQAEGARRGSVRDGRGSDASRRKDGTTLPYIESNSQGQGGEWKTCMLMLVATCNIGMTQCQRYIIITCFVLNGNYTTCRLTLSLAANPTPSDQMC